MKRSSTVFFKIVIVLIGMVVFALMLWEPHLEGRNVNATPYQIYFNDPFLAYAYASSIAFFMAAYQAFKLLGYIEENKVLNSVKALRTIKYCMATLIVAIAGAEAYLFIVQRSKEDDIIGGVFIGLLLIFASTIIATAAAVFEKRFSKQLVRP